MRGAYGSPKSATDMAIERAVNSIYDAGLHEIDMSFADLEKVCARLRSEGMNARVANGMKGAPAIEVF